MDPTLVAPTAHIEKKPCSHLPVYTARSLKLKSPWIQRATPGLTLNSSPVNEMKVITPLNLILHALSLSPSLSLSLSLSFSLFHSLSVLWGVQVKQHWVLSITTDDELKWQSDVSSIYKTATTKSHHDVTAWAQYWRSISQNLLWLTH